MSANIKEKLLYGCQHYKRNCNTYLKCCKKWYKCNICHDENCDHDIDISTIKRIKCLYCNKTQLPKQYCNNINCGKKLGEYFCNKCFIYSNDIETEPLYHCDKCNRCIHGEESKFSHCDTCNFCYDINEYHICIENKLMSDCSICLTNMKNSEKKITTLLCGHAIHSNCFDLYVDNIICENGNRKLFCPICRTILLNMDNYTDYIVDDTYTETNTYNTEVINNNFSLPITYNSVPDFNIDNILLDDIILFSSNYDSNST